MTDETLTEKERMLVRLGYARARLRTAVAGLLEDEDTFREEFGDDDTAAEALSDASDDLLPVLALIDSACAYFGASEDFLDRINDMAHRAVDDGKSENWQEAVLKIACGQDEDQLAERGLDLIEAWRDRLDGRDDD